MSNKLKIAFFGSSTFSIPTLAELIKDNDFKIEYIITLPPAKQNRGKKLQNNVVYDFAIKNGFNEKNIFTPKTLRNNNELVNILKTAKVDFIIVVAYGKIITKEIIELPKYEILNLHPSSLPKYRGASPIERAIEAGEDNLDICIMKVDVGLDTGDVAVRQKYTIDNNDFASDIVPDVAQKGALLMVNAIKKIVDNQVIFEKQKEEGLIYANKIEKEELFIDLTDKTLSAKIVLNKIRAFNNHGCCFFILDGYRVKIIKAELLENHNEKNLKDSKTTFGFDYKTGYIIFHDGMVKPTILQKEGKKPVQLKDFLNGIKQKVG